MRPKTAVDIFKSRKRKHRKKKYWFLDSSGQRQYVSNLKQLPYKQRQSRMAKNKASRLTKEEKLAIRQARHEATVRRKEAERIASRRLTALRREERRKDKLAEQWRLQDEKERARREAKAKREAERYAKMSPRGKKLHDWWQSEKGQERKRQLREFYKTDEGKARLHKMQEGRARKRLQRIAELERNTDELEPIGYGNGISSTSDIIELILKEIDDIPTVVWYSKGEFVDTEQWKARFRNIIDFNIANFGLEEYSNYLEKYYDELMTASFVIQVESDNSAIMTNLAIIQRILTAGELSKEDNIQATEATRAMEALTDEELDRNFLRKAGVNW